MFENDEKSKWLLTYAAQISKRLAKCKKSPSWEQYPAGHMRLAQGFTPEAAAKAYLAETMYGRQAGADLT